MPQKKCSCCKQQKDTVEFGQDKHRLDGRNCRCKQCARSKSKEAMRLKRATAEGREKSNASARRWLKRTTATAEGREMLNRAARVREQIRRNDPSYVVKKREAARRSKNRIRATPEGRERLNRARRLFDKKNPGKANAKAMRRKAAKLRAIPVWADKKEIARIYDNCPAGHHVDHIIPLQGEAVCGLHTQENLQYLAALDNCRKGNRIGETDA